MNKYVPFEKLSKKKQKEQNAKRRGSWGNVNPVTRKPPNPKAYNRKKARRDSRPDCITVPYFYDRTLRPTRKRTPKGAQKNTKRVRRRTPKGCA